MLTQKRCKVNPTRDETIANSLLCLHTNLIRIIQGYDYFVEGILESTSSIDFRYKSHNQTTIVGIKDGDIYLFDIETQTQILIFWPYYNESSEIVILPNNDVCCTKYNGTCTLYIFRCNKWQEITIEKPLAHIWKLYALSDNRLASSETLHGNIRIWNTETLKCECELLHTDGVICVQELADGRLACGGRERYVRIWNTKDCTYEVLYTENRCIFSLRKLLDGRLIGGSVDGYTFIWKDDILESIMPLNISGFTVLPDNSIAVYSAHGLENVLYGIKIWDINNIKCTSQFACNVMCCVIALKNGKIMCVSNWKLFIYK